MNAILSYSDKLNNFTLSVSEATDGRFSIFVSGRRNFGLAARAGFYALMFVRKDGASMDMRDGFRISRDGTDSLTVRLNYDKRTYATHADAQSAAAMFVKTFRYSQLSAAEQRVEDQCGYWD